MRGWNRSGWKPGVASRGYGREDADKPLWVQADTPTAKGGDEPVLIAWKTGVPVRVDADRVAAGRALIQAGCDVIVCDDGLQHYRLARDIEIEVVDAQRRYGNGLLMPAGPLREPAARARDCDFRVVNLGQASDAGQVPPGSGFGEWTMRLRIDSARPLRGGRERPLHGFSGQRVHAVAGIAHPQRFFQMLRAQGLVPMSVELVHTGQNTAGGSSALGQRLFTRPVFGATALAIWTRQLAGLVSSGLPLERALTALSEEADDDKQRHLLAAKQKEAKLLADFGKPVAPAPMATANAAIDISLR